MNILNATLSDGWSWIGQLGEFAQVSLPLLDFGTMCLLGGVLAFLAMTYVISQYLERQPDWRIDKRLVRSFNRRALAWWMMYAMMTASLFTGRQRFFAVLFFFVISLMSLREFISLTFTRLGDHRALFWVFYVFTPLQYLFVWLGQDRTYGLVGVKIDAGQLFMILIPVYAFLFIPARVAFAGDHKRFLERTAKTQSGLLVCVYALSHAPALLDLPLRWPEGRLTQDRSGILVFLLLVVQISDVAEILWSRATGRHVIAPDINPNKTWEGALGSLITGILAGMSLFWVTPFSVMGAGALGFLISITGMAGSMTMSAIKRDRGVRDYGTLVEGHPGFLDRFDSICFAAPVYFHFVKSFYT
jgi:phosphatidate cytidylyltransferase